MRSLAIIILWVLSTVVGQSTTLERSGWNLIAVCQDISSSEVDMTNITEIQRQDGATLYSGEWFNYSNLESLEAGYAYWVKGNSGVLFESGEANGELIIPLKRTGWNLMGACQDIAADDIDMHDFDEIQAQNGDTLYSEENRSLSDLTSLREGYGYWVKGDQEILYTAKYHEIPEIIGTPRAIVHVYESYNFMPSVKGMQTDMLTFTIQNQPAWAEFNSSTGRLSGELNSTTVGLYENIIIGVSDGVNPMITLAPFSIDVQPALNIAHLYGKATQPPKDGYYYYKEPALAIDGNLNTNNHTQCSAPNNWLQIELPEATKVHKVVIYNITGQQARLNGSTVYLRNDNYTGSEEVNSSKSLATLNSTMIQTVTPSNIEESRYLLIKGNPVGTNSCLHLYEVEVYGELTGTPWFEAEEDEEIFVNESAVNGTVVANVAANDFQGDRLTYSLIGDVPFTVDSDGNIVVNGLLDYGTYTFDVRVSDGVNSATRTINITANSEGEAENIAHKFGVATQSSDESYQYYHDPANAIDNNLSTMNMTADGGWLQVALPKGTQLSKVVVRNRTDAWTGRISGTRVYVGTQDFNGTIIESDYIGTLTSSTEPQVFTFDTLIDGDYIFLQEDDDNLHVLEVEAYGVTPATPALHSDHYTLGVVPYTPIDTVVGRIEAIDYQNDRLTYTIVGDVPFAIDSNGTLKLTEVINHNLTQQYDFSVEMSDGINSVSTDVTVHLLAGAGVKAERWNGISGTAVSDLFNSVHYQDAPDETRTMTALDMNENRVNNFGERYTTILKPAVSGYYTFAIIGDDGTELRLSTDANMANVETIAYKLGWGSYQNWSGAGKSKAIYLEAGNLYAIEAFLKESGGAEHISVGWKRADESSYSPIPADQLFVELLDEEKSKPIFETHEREYLIAGSSQVDLLITTISANDSQGDALMYEIRGEVPFRIDNSGNIFVNGSLEAGTYTFDIVVSDGENEVTTTIDIEVTSANAVEEALQSGDMYHVTEEELLQAAREEIERLRIGSSLLADIYQDGSIAYATGGYSSQLISIHGDISKISPILYGNDNHILAIAGEKEQSRFAVFASNPLYFFDRDENLDFEPYMQRVFSWLMAGEPIDINVTDTSKTVALSFANSSSAVERWLSANYPSWSLKTCNDRVTLESCYADADLLLLGRQGNDDDAAVLTNVLPNMFIEGKAILYLHDNWGESSLSDVMENLFEFSFPYGGNYWAVDAASWTDVEAMQSTYFNSFGYAAIDTMLQHFQDQDYDFDWNQCTDGKGNYGSEYDKCGDIDGLYSRFQAGATKVRQMLGDLDRSKKAIFTTDGYRLQKLLALIGDKFRQIIAYPMDKVTTEDNEFMRAYYADHAVYNYRTINPVPEDLGNFSRTDFSHITPTTKTVNLVSKTNFRSAGVYALPGETMRVTRNDNSAVTAKIFINSLRSGSTHEFETNGYSRPKFLQSAAFEIKPQESIEITSPYGGPVHIALDTNDLDVSFTFENIGEHPYWNGPEDNAIFAEKLDAGEYDWAEMVTSGFEVHSTLEKMRESIADPIWGSAEALAAGTRQYIGDFPYVLAGFKGPGVDVVNEIHDFATAKGLEIQTIDRVQHMNADQATCGYGCSGNPYDAYWSFTPIGHGDIHELGHNLEKSRLRFEGFEVHASTNPYSYYTKSKYNEMTGGDPDCQNLPFRELFEAIQASVHEANATQYLKDNLWSNSNWSHQVLVTIEAMMQTQAMGKLENGWHLLARLHILEREIGWVKSDWENRKGSLGFTNYTLDEFNAMRANDWLLVSFSFAAELDFRDYLTMMGMEYSQKAADQVAGYGYEMVPKRFFLSTPNGYCKSDDLYGAYLDKDTLPIDGNVSGWVEDSEYVVP